LDFRFAWSRVPLWLTILSQLLVFAGYLITLWVMKENSFASRTVQIEEGQRVISSGPYRLVRHPMYFGAVLMLLFTPSALGSWWALPGFLLVIPLIVLRLLNEEKMLCRDLPAIPTIASTRAPASSPSSGSLFQEKKSLTFSSYFPGLHGNAPANAIEAM